MKKERYQVLNTNFRASEESFKASHTSRDSERKKKKRNVVGPQKVRRGNIPFNTRFVPLEHERSNSFIALINNADTPQRRHTKPALSQTHDSEKNLHIEHTITEINKQIKISGQQCMVKAYIVNGHVIGSVNCEFSNKNYKFELTPILNQKYQEIDLEKEISRLYFDLVLSGYETDFELKIKSKAQIDKYFSLLKIDGSQSCQNSCIFSTNYEKGVIAMTCTIFQTQNIKNSEIF